MQVRIRKVLTVTLLGLGIGALGCGAKASAKISAGTPKPPEPPAVAPTPAPEPPKAEEKKPDMSKIGAALKKVRARLKGDRIEIDEKVHFATGKAEILADSFPLLDDVAGVLNENAAVKCEVAGHTDNVGKASMNKKLSQDRADAVKAYLLGKGIAVERLSATGYGPDQPEADNATEEGKERNRRVEFRVAAAGTGTAAAGEPAATAEPAKGKKKSKKTEEKK